ncbi:MAG: ATP-dependent Clp protease adaptor ClpS [Verrucomicrobiota bacterium]
MSAPTLMTDPTGNAPGTVEIPVPQIDPEAETRVDRERDYVVVAWDDPVNLMPYVTHVFQQVFGWSHDKAHRHMLEVHEKGRSALVRESFEKAEHHVHALQKYSLNATIEPGLP